MSWRLGEDVAVDTDSLRVVRSGREVHLEPQAFDLLVYLIEHRDRVVPHDELLDNVWQHRAYSDAALTTRIKEIRRALGDDGRTQRIIRNVRGRGYQLVIDVVAIAAVDDRRGATAAPGARSTLIGRNDDRQGITERLRTGSMVTIVGPGGVGKTALAMAVAHELSGDVVEGAVVVELGDHSDPAAVLPAVARATAVVFDPTEPHELATALASRSMILVLDNCEHVVTEVGGLLRRLFSRPTAVKVLATSRERIGLSTELVWPLLPLSESDAVALFIARAEAATPSFDPDAIDAERLRSLVRGLDLLPLTIEMAAAQLSSLGLGELEALVATRLSALRTVDRGAPARQRTVSAVVDWSTERLDDDERSILARLSVFAGWFGSQDVVAVLGTDVPASLLNDAVAGLAQRSLLLADTSRAEARYRMLESVRDWARARTGVNGAEELRRRHARWFLEVAAQGDRDLRSTGEAAAHRRLADATGDLGRAVDWALENDPEIAASFIVALGHYGYTRLWSAPVDWARRAVANAAGERDPAPFAVLAADAAHRMRFDDAERLATSALTSKLPAARAFALEVLSDTAVYQGDLPGAIRLCDELVGVGEATNDLHLVTIGAVNRALALIYDGSPQLGLDVVDTFRTPRDALSPSDLGWWLYARAEALADDHDTAADLLEELIELSALVENRLLASVGESSLASLHQRHGHHTEARAIFLRCLEGHRHHGNTTHARATLTNLVPVFRELGPRQLADDITRALAAEHTGAVSAATAPTVDELIDRALAALRS